MKKLINYLGGKNVIISMVENGDSTDGTRKHLEEFQKYLNEKNIINRLLLEHEIDDERKTYSNIISLKKIILVLSKFSQGTSYKKSKHLFLNLA